MPDLPEGSMPWPDDAEAPPRLPPPPVESAPPAARMAPRAGAGKPARCALCGRGFEHREEQPGPFFPFCSLRCRAVDLGNWLDEAYRIETAALDNEDAGDPAEDET